MLESRPEDALVQLVQTVETVETVEIVKTVKTVETVETAYTARIPCTARKLMNLQISHILIL